MPPPPEFYTSVIHFVDIDSEDKWEKDGDGIDNSQRILAFDDEANL